MAEKALELDLVSRAVARLEDNLDRDAVPTIEAALRIGDSTPPGIPAVVVFLAADDASDSAAPTAGAYQRVTATLAVAHVIAARNTPRGAGGPVVDPLSLLTGRTRGVLNGWVPERLTFRPDALALRRGRLINIANGRAVWQDEYRVSWRAQRVQNQSV